MNKRFLGVLLLMLGILLLAGCTTTESGTSVEVTAETEVDAVAHATPAGEGWHVTLTGVRTDELWESQAAADPKWLETVQFEKKGELRTYTALAFSEVIAMIDDADGSMPYSFQQGAWDAGYDITVTAADGFAATFNTADYPAEGIYLAVTQDGESTLPMLVGDIPGQIQVKDIVSIETSLAPVALEENQFEFILEIGDKTATFTLAELEDHPYFIEGPGEYKNTYDNVFTHVWGGVKLVDLISDVFPLTADQSVTIIATDGYEMDYSGSQLLDQADGTWILAFIEDGEYMPEDPGYIRLVKVGPDTPQITGHISARMVKKVQIKDVSFTDFTLSIDSAAGTEELDRQTIQSGVTSQRTTVNYFNKKSGETVSYLGLPLFEFLAHYDGYDTVTVEASDRYSITLAADEVAGNSDVILAMYYGDGSELSENEAPLIIVWDAEADLVPAGIKAVRSVTRLILD